MFLYLDLYSLLEVPAMEEALGFVKSVCGQTNVELHKVWNWRDGECSRECAQWFVSKWVHSKSSHVTHTKHDPHCCLVLGFTVANISEKNRTHTTEACHLVLEEMLKGLYCSPAVSCFFPLHQLISAWSVSTKTPFYGFKKLSLFTFTSRNMSKIFTSEYTKVKFC